MTNSADIFPRKTGRLAYCVMDLKVKRVYKGSAVGQRKSGKSYELYDIPLTKVKLVNSKGKRIKASAVKKNDLVRVCFNGDILERYPAAFQEIVKIKTFVGGCKAFAKFEKLK